VFARKTIGGGLFVLEQLIAVGGATYTAIDSGILLFEDINNCSGTRTK